MRVGLRSIRGSGWILIPTSYQQNNLQFKVSHLGRVGCLHLFYPHTHTFCNVDKHRPDRQAHAPISMNQTQLAWILNLAHECSSFIDAAPEEKFTLPSNGSCFTLKLLFCFFFTVVTHGGCVTSGRHIACQVVPSRPQKAEVLLFASHVRVPPCHIWCECLVFRLPELISRALGRIPRAALSCDISPRCAVRQPAPSPLQICKLTQMTLRVPLETRCSEIRKDPFHTSAARQRDGWTKGKWEGGRIKEGEWERLVGGTWP